MPRVARAAQQLIRQVGGSPVGEPDGLGVIRTVDVFGYAHDYALDILRKDRRVREVTRVGDSVLVTFVAGTAADSTEPFDL